ncbi:unnamed protein product [Didymodactylos carnosus]|uniref:DOMON domain-containing protein n=1 Tax=Didymodactylos carnosus TaxID=1234261 RepID=A0A814M7B7_9BILA|nr:unnamed protein product [Didymodactylos carnosus]CAF1274299.1 unnamed protein product [Didymodactylos carnosus]CAF3842127.1 unnamed protein product [Didymodactylos carnosus]CAF4079477.1 unnamed protein product [Didymodactylos carnosus]
MPSPSTTMRMFEPSKMSQSAAFGVAFTEKMPPLSTIIRKSTISERKGVSKTTAIAVVPTTLISPSNRNIRISWTYSSEVTTVQMVANNLKVQQWVALGLSLDEEMGEDHVFVCQHLSDNSIVVKRLINPGGHVVPIAAPSNDGGTFNATQAKIENSVVTCGFTLSNFGSRKKRRSVIPTLSQTVKYHPLVAVGPLDSSNSMRMHTSKEPQSQLVSLNGEAQISYNPV